MNTVDDYDRFADARKAASLIILRDRKIGLQGEVEDDRSVDNSGGRVEVLMLRRAERDGDLRSGATVFPGGVVDRRDRQAAAHCLGWDEAAANARLSLAEGALDYLVAAARESFEEVGLLFTSSVHHDGSLHASAHAAAHADWRTPMQRGEQPIDAMCAALGLKIDLRGWAYYSYWLTPPGVPKRFDTRFFVTVAPSGQEAVADGGEAVELMWLTPAEALAPTLALKLLPVTRRMLQHLGSFDRAQDVIDATHAQAQIPMTMPRRAHGAQGLRPVLPDEPAYAEIGRLDPAGLAPPFYDIAAGRVVRLSPRVLRVTAPNPGVMTGPGTNSYLVADPQVNRWTVIDPGPVDADHMEALLAAAPGPIERIVVTHTHRDHSPGVAALATFTGAPVLGRSPLHAGGQDETFAPTLHLAGSEIIRLGPQATLRVIHTPGHASNHLCYLLEEEKTLFTGDHVMQGSTVVINPPDGDMAAYLDALRALLEIDLDWLAPGHGFLVAQPHAVIRALIRHRLGREAKVLAALQGLTLNEPASIDKLVAAAYADTSLALHPVARRSLLAHLLKLQSDGLALAAEEGWALA